jgi:hypothetical protein
VEGFVDFAAPLHTEPTWDLDGDIAEFVHELEQRASDAENADDLGWLFRQATRDGDLGCVECSDGRVNVGDRVEALVRELSEFNGDAVRRAETLAEVAELRLACRRTADWRSADYDWPLLSE